MTLVNIDLRNQGYETGPGDRVIFYSLLVREGEFGTISTAPVEVRLTDGKATVDLAPGPVGVQIIAGMVADTRVREGRVPMEGPTTLNVVLTLLPEYSDAVRESFLAAIRGAQDTALSRIDAEVAVAVGAEMGGVTALSEEALSRAKAAEGVAATADAKSTSATSTASTAVSTASNAVARVTALEAMSGLSPESPVDGQQASLMLQRETLTNQAMRTVITQAVGTVDLVAYGVSPSNSPADNSAAILAAVAEHDGTGRTILFPPGHIKIDAPIVSMGGLNFRGAGKYLTTVEQVSDSSAIFDIQGADARVDHMKIYLRPGVIDRSVGIRARGDNVHVADIHGAGFTSIAFWQARDATSGEWKPQALSGGSAHRISMEDTSYGILIEGCDHFRFSHLSGSYWLQPKANAPHLLYVSDAHHRSRDMQGWDCMATDGQSSYAYQFKAVDGLRAWRLGARDCRGVLHIMGCTDVRIDGVESLGDTHGSSLQGSVDIGTGSEDVQITGLYVEMEANGKALKFHDGTSDCLVAGTAITNHTTTSGVQGAYDVDISGIRNTARMTVRNKGPVPWGSSIGIWGGEGHIVDRPVTEGNGKSVTVRSSAGSVGHIVRDYDRREMGSSSGIPMEIGDNAGVTLQPRAINRDPSVIVQEHGEAANGSTNYLALAIPDKRWQVSWPSVSAYEVLPEGGIRSRASDATAHIDTGSTDVDVSAMVRVQDRDGLAVRVYNRNHLIGARYNAQTGTVDIYTLISGGGAVVASEDFPVVPGRRYRIRIISVGDTVEAIFDDRVYLSYTLTTEEQGVYTDTRHGMRTFDQGAAFSDIAFRNPT